MDIPYRLSPITNMLKTMQPSIKYQDIKILSKVIVARDSSVNQVRVRCSLSVKYIAERPKRGLVSETKLSNHIWVGLRHVMGKYYWNRIGMGIYYALVTAPIFSLYTDVAKYSCIYIRITYSMGSYRSSDFKVTLRIFSHLISK